MIQVPRLIGSDWFAASGTACESEADDGLDMLAFSFMVCVGHVRTLTSLPGVTTYLTTRSNYLLDQLDSLVGLLNKINGRLGGIR
jgi:hypothetical protein